MSACWYWQSRGLSKLADEGRFRDITRKINGGYNGLEDREKLYNRCKRMLNV
jgi:putative chitinase